MLLKNAFKRLVWWMVTAYITRIVFGRATIFGMAYFSAHSNYWKQSDILLKCKNDSEIASHFSESCDKAKVIVSQWPIVDACASLVEQTHSCIDFACMDVLMTILDSWIMIILAPVVACLIFFIVTSKFYDILQMRWYASERKRSEALREFNENSVFIDLQPDNYRILETMDNNQDLSRHRNVQPLSIK